MRMELHDFSRSPLEEAPLASDKKMTAWVVGVIALTIALLIFHLGLMVGMEIVK